MLLLLLAAMHSFGFAKRASLFSFSPILPRPHLLADGLDLMFMQWDLYFHHAVGLLLVPYFIVRATLLERIAPRRFFFGRHSAFFTASIDVHRSLRCLVR